MGVKASFTGSVGYLCLFGQRLKVRSIKLTQLVVTTPLCHRGRELRIAFCATLQIKGELEFPANFRRLGGIKERIPGRD